MQKVKILIAGTDTGLSSSVAHRLKRLGYSAASATSIRDVIRKAVSIQPDVIIVDLKASGAMEGSALARILRARFAAAFVFLAPASRKNKVKRAHGDAASKYLFGSFTDEELRSCLESAVQMKTGAFCFEKESWCHSVVRSIGDAVIVTERTGLVVFLNPAAEKLTGWTLDSATGLGLQKVFRVISEDMRRPVSIPFGKIIRGHSTSIPGHLILVDPNGNERHIENSASALADVDGNVTGVVIVFRDVTDRHVMAKNALSKQKIEAMGILAKGIARDFGSLISTSGSYAASLADSLIPRTKAHEDALKIIDSIKSARELISRLLDLARASESSSGQATSSVSLAQVIADTSVVLEKTLAERKISFRTENPANMPYVKADAGQLLDSLMSIFLNSVDAMPQGGTLSVKVSERRITTPSRKSNPDAKRGTYAVVRITDSGHGIPHDVLDHVFEPFFTTKQPGMAKGIGLSIVHNTIVSWGGWTTIRSASKKGTTVSLFIPVCAAPVSSMRRIATGGETILVIDDNDADISFFRSVLETQGYKVYSARSGAEGLSILKKTKDEIDIAIVDLIMPPPDGREVFHAIVNRDPDAAVIITTGFSRDYVRSTLGQGGWGFVQKPIDRTQLLNAVTRAFEQRLVSSSNRIEISSDRNAGEKTTV